jgi:hypothetical protein
MLICKGIIFETEWLFEVPQTKPGFLEVPKNLLFPGSDIPKGQAKPALLG